MTIETYYSMTQSDLEEFADQIKVAILMALADSDVIVMDDAREWAENHTVILRKKGIFRTLTDKWRKTEEVSGHEVIVVGKV